jgi:hypothetical protein
MWRKIRPYLVAAKLDPVRIENPIHPGTPDVNLTVGWIELKCLETWPVRAHSLVNIKHYTPQQRLWAYRRWKYAPGTTFLLLEVRSVRQWLLFDGDVAAKIVGRATEVVHRTSARAVLHERELAELPKILTKEVPGSLREEQPVCTGSLTHDPFTYCPAHDFRAN